MARRPRGDVALPQQRGEQRETLAGHRRMALVGLVFEPDARAAASTDSSAGDAIVAEPLLPPVVARIDQMLVRNVVRLELAAEPALDLARCIPGWPSA